MLRIRQSAHNSLYKAYERLLTREVMAAPLPRHVAIIQDGNRRYADKIGEPRFNGHVYGALTTERVLTWCLDLGIKHTTLYTFSTENCGRPNEELSALFALLQERFNSLGSEEKIYEKQVRVRMIGERGLIPDNVLQSIERVEQATSHFTQRSLNFALAYGGRKEIVDVVQGIARLVETNLLDVEDINEQLLKKHFYDNSALEDVDLIIRSGGEERLSNFLPWQASGSECCSYFCAPYWPEFRRIDLLRAIRTFQDREQLNRVSVVQRAIRLLNEVGKVEIGEVFRLSRRACTVTYDEVNDILKDSPSSVMPNND